MKLLLVITSLFLAQFVTAAVNNEEVKIAIDVSQRGHLEDINGHKYFIGHGNSTDDAFTAEEGMEACINMGMRLISFNKLPKWANIYGYIKEDLTEFYTSYWTTGMYIKELDPTDWRWRIRDELVSFEFSVWASGQPRGMNFNNASCLWFSAFEGWFSEDCSAVRTIICE